MRTQQAIRRNLFKGVRVPPATASALLLETADTLLLESGERVLLES